MIKELGILASAMSLYTSGVRSPQYRSHEVVENDIAITYKYETNEVNSVDDLIVGNVYHFSIINDSIDSYLMQLGVLDIIFLNVDNQDFSSYEFEFDGLSNSLSNTFNLTLDFFVEQYVGSFYMPYGANDSYISIVTIGDLSTNSFTIEGDCILHDVSELRSYECFSICENVPIESVRRVYPDNIFGYVSEFIDEHLLNGIPNVDDVSYTIGGKSITMRSWLNTSICVVLAVLLIALLVWFIRYLFRLFSGLLH